MVKLDLGLPSYMGRGIIAGVTTEYKPAAIYFVQGRSPPSRKRMLKADLDNGMVYVDVNSETSIEKMVEAGGNPDLLRYVAMMGDPKGLLVVSNGLQTNCDPIWEGEGREKENLKGAKPNGGIYNRIKKGYEQGFSNSERLIWESLYNSLFESGSEVDPIRTARIASVIDTEKDPYTYYMGIVIRERDLCDSSKFRPADSTVVMSDKLVKNIDKGRFIMLATYGVNNPPYYAALPPDISNASGWTKCINLDGLTPEELVEEVWTGLPKEIMVGVAAAMRGERGFTFGVTAEMTGSGGFNYAVRNMQE
jgi:IMP cyclohydrolase